jgi:elongation factor Ts
MVGTIGENLTIRRAAYYHIGSPGLVAGYIHGEGKFGVLAAFSTSAETRDERLAELARDICLHICASAPVVVRDSELGEDAIERERRVFTEQAIESGKPREIAEKMVVGRLAKWKKEVCLVDQPFVKNPDLTIAAEIARVSKEIGVEIQIQAFTRFARGEGIEKEKTDFAAEVAAALQ